MQLETDTKRNYPHIETGAGMIYRLVSSQKEASFFSEALSPPGKCIIGFQPQSPGIIFDNHMYHENPPSPFQPSTSACLVQKPSLTLGLQGAEEREEKGETCLQV